MKSKIRNKKGSPKNIFRPFTSFQLIDTSLNAVKDTSSTDVFCISMFLFTLKITIKNF